MNIAIIPSDYYISLKYLREKGFDGRRLKQASGIGGVLDRHQSKKTRRVYYRNKTIPMNFKGDS